MLFFALSALGMVVAGMALLALLGLSTRAPLVDVALGWFAGTGWVGIAALAARLLLGIPFGRPAGFVFLSAPVVAWAVLRLRGSPGASEPGPKGRIIPRPSWLYVPLVIYVIVVSVSVVVHGANTPTHTDDGVRVRAFTPMLAFDDRWEPEARQLLTTAGAVPTFAPALGWVLSGTVDHFHVNYVVLTDFLALLALIVGLGMRSGSPERGWASAFAVLSIPMFVYHCTSTYQDAVLAILMGAVVLLMMEHGRSGKPREAALALMFAVIATMVKQEGQIVGASVGGVILARMFWRKRGSEVLPRRALASLAIVFVLAISSRVAAVGLSQALPMLNGLVTRTVGGDPGGPLHELRQMALVGFARALFHSGNAGMLYWLLPVSILAGARRVATSAFAWPLVIVALLFVQVLASSAWFYPEFTVQETTVHRALLVVSVPAAIWLAAFLVDGVALEGRRSDALPVA